MLLRCRLVLCLFTCGLAAASAANLTEAQLAAVRAASERRHEEFFRKDAGKPLVPAPIKPNWNKRGDYTRDYGHAIVVFAMRAFWLGERLDEANAALRELCEYHLARPQTLLEVHSFPSVCDALLRVERFFGPRGSRAPGRLTAETRATVLRTLWAWASEKSKLADAETKESQTWHLEHSENHHAQHFSTCWGFSLVLQGEPEYRDRRYADGHTAREHYVAWTAYLREYLRERAAKGMTVEIDSPSYASATLKGIYSFYDFSDDPLLKRRAGDWLSLYWALWAEHQLDGVSGGAKTRTYAESAEKGTDFLRRAAWYALGVGDPEFRHASMLPFVTTTWRMPDVVVDLALGGADLGTYEIRQRRMGLALAGHAMPPRYRLRTDFGGIVRYGYRTPDFIVGSLLLEARPDTDWAAISGQNRWMGAIFRGHTDARIYPATTNRNGASIYNGHWAAQAHGTLIAQQLKTNRRAEDWRVWFSKAGLSAPVRDGRWVFAEAAGAYAAVGVVRGEFTWDETRAAKAGRWLVCAEAQTPVILEIARKTEFATLSAFRAAVTARPLRFDAATGVLDYTGLAGDRFRFYADQSRLPEIGGKTVDLVPARVFDSPFVQSDWNSGVVTVRKGERVLALDFNR